MTKFTTGTKKTGLAPDDLKAMSDHLDRGDRKGAIEQVAVVQTRHREALLEQGIDVRAITPEIGREISWTDVVRQVFRVLEFDRAGTTVGPNDTVKPASRAMPYGYLLVESPILNQPARLPVNHRVDFLLAASVFDDADLAEAVVKEELPVTYAPKKGLAGCVLHPLHFVVTPRGTLDRYYEFGNDVHMAAPALEKLFGKLVYLPREFWVDINTHPRI